jgi:hypothetical protein
MTTSQQKTVTSGGLVVAIEFLTKKPEVACA